jgi:lipooligosaccharide transport system permease protein
VSDFALEKVNAAKVRRFGSWYVAEYRLLNMRKWLGAILAFGLGNPILFLTSVGIGIGSLVDNNAGSAGVDGVRYMTFLAPALLASAAIQGAMDEVTFPTLHGFVWEKVFFGMSATALNGKQVARGILIASLVRNIFTVVSYWIILFAFGALDSPRAWLAIPAGVFAGAAVAHVMLAVSAYVTNDEGLFSVIGQFVIAPMFMFSGTFYPLSLMPVYLQWIGWISPLWHATEIGRYLTYDHPIDTGLLIVHFAYLAVIMVIGTIIAERRYAWRLAQ